MGREPSPGQAPDDVMVALVVLAPASGRPLAGASITAETLGEFLPDRRDVEVVTGALQSLGFEVGPVVGISASIAGPPVLFERVFGTRVVGSDEGGWVAVDEHRGPTRDLPVFALDPGLARRIAAVTFEPPTELHDGGDDVVNP